MFAPISLRLIFDFPFRHRMASPISHLPPEIIDLIFSFVHLSTESQSPRTRDRLGWLSAAHVCHQWREIALNQPRFWSYIDFTALTLDGVTEMLIRSKGVPLHLVANMS